MTRKLCIPFILLYVILIVACTPIKKANEFYSTGQYELAIEQCRAALSADSTNILAYTLAGQSWLALRQSDSALVYFIKGINLDSANSICNERIAAIHVQAGDELLAARSYNKAIEKYRLALQYRANDNTVQEKIGDALYQSGSLDQALHIFSAIHNYSDSVRIQSKVQEIRSTQNTADNYIKIGRDHYNSKKYDAAKQQFSKALEIVPDNREAKYFIHMTKAMPLYRKATVASLWDAIAEFGLAAAINPESGEPHYFMAMAYNKKDKDEYSNAISEFELAIQVEPDGPYAAESAKKIAELKARRKKMQDFLSR
ncbi:MAG TPA: tetratricopeptide repeat protein [bacterium]|nr:tetratricopeptide repeat protein [bacterium]HPN43036.1 tetratricopeptide repeat protein [bacterium]